MQAFLIQCKEHIGENQSHQPDRNPRTHPSLDPRPTTQENGRGKDKDNDKKKIKSPYKLPNYQHHEWKDCFNNPHSDNFKGTAKSPKEFNTEGSAKKDK